MGTKPVKKFRGIGEQYIQMQLDREMQENTTCTNTCKKSRVTDLGT